MGKTRTPHFRQGKESKTLFMTTCKLTGKRIYEARGDARTARARIGGRKMNIYRCDDCSGYHLGHLPRSVVVGELARDEACR